MPDSDGFDDRPGAGVDHGHGVRRVEAGAVGAEGRAVAPVPTVTLSTTVPEPVSTTETVSQWR
ncbi:hypothetical protein [Streptomyces sp. NRRL F-4474]|uniref:hypothetical protein n=1 Tax=Streptomyces sp. NRRL F-4474 TaxID=1463851 RepID=UPI000AC22516|nr:hypothetical protein [Streptomyces sp. NRRL F-4474]